MNCRPFCCICLAWPQTLGTSRIPERQSRSHLPWVPFKTCSCTKEDRLGGAGRASLRPLFPARRGGRMRSVTTRPLSPHIFSPTSNGLDGLCHRGRHLPFQTKPWSWSGFAGAWSVRQPVWRQGHAVVSQKIPRAASPCCQDWERDHRRGVSVGEHPKDELNQKF